jgi:hypothetical protein
MSDEPGLAPPVAVTAVVGTAAAAAGGVHAMLVAPHAEVAPWQGIGFAVVGAVQLFAALRVVTRPGRDAIAGTGAICGAAVLAWVCSRTFGTPGPPDPWSPEAVGVLDSTVVAIELVPIGVWVAWRVRGRPPAMGRATLPGLLMLGSVAIAALVMAQAASAHGTSSDHVHAHIGHAISFGAGFLLAGLATLAWRSINRFAHR